ncbi:hypothetical protein M2451_003794 [Dysgonomonas sp. PFB1-18]|uniref:hypothetical protein n=1 Tax=unclassified Dysgonomonas TaxID=2630389 RepID=UPI002474F4A3|nr:MULTISPECIES: hypothetical protein [unclassified Dysgonomonas]MDH6310930.1 hypothetical protein [Dysgonomonas sp. PF1-14]MDH6340855.1 hypothetical protein [Dysgonomonas sp. PF1-16]MDH6382453.1 hypothetical protein [Dysgonomonas sp. PFB1-18]MDH6399802.1 hypothetical protein [Dysgonomonas sp. PF1-23]
MRTGTQSVTCSAGENTIIGRRTQIDDQGHCPGKTETASVRKPSHDFLKTVFKTRPLTDSPCNPYSATRYRYLNNSVKKYARLLGKPMTIAQENGNLSLLGEQLGLLLPNTQEYRLILEDGILKFQIVDMRNDRYLFHLPCKIIEETDGDFKELLIEFFRLLQKQYGLDSFLDNQYFEFAFQYFERDSDPEDEFINLVNRYRKGDICATLRQVDPDKPCSFKGLKKKLKMFEPYTQREKRWKELISEGLQFLRKRRCLGSMCMQPDIDPENYYTVGIEHSLVIIYDDDGIEESFLEFLNDNAQESGFDFFSAGVKTISPYIKKPLELDPYIINFINWIKKINHELYYI